MQNDPTEPYEFSLTDLASAGLLSKRNAQYLTDGNFLPGKGILAVKRIAVVGAFVGGGVPLLVAAGLADAIRSEFNRPDGEVPSGFDNWVRDLCSLPGFDTVNLTDEYAIHSALFSNLEIYQSGRPLGSDALAEVCDKRHVFIGNAARLGAEPDGNMHEPFYAGRIEGWDRSGDVKFVSVPEVYHLDPAHPRFEADQKHLEYMVNVARPKAVGRLTVNVSLAVRNGFDQVGYHHDAKYRRKSGD